MTIPALRLYIDHRTATPHWCVDIRYATKRLRVKLGCPADDDPAAPFAAWKRDVLPGIVRVLEETAAPQTDKRHRAPGSESPRIRDIIDWFIGSHLPFLGRSIKTIDRYDQVLRDFELYCRAHHIGRVDQLSWARIEEWQAWMFTHRPAKAGYGRSQTSKRDEVSIVRRMFNAAQETGKVATSPILKWFIPKARGKSKYRALSLEELRNLLRLVDEKEPTIAPLVHWLAATGWRIEDALDLRWNEIDLRAGVIAREQIKIADDLDYPLTQGLRDILARVPAGKGAAFVFPLPTAASERKTSIKRAAYLHRHLTRACERHGLPRAIPRDLRKTFGTHMASGAFHPQGIPCPPKILQSLMGHKQIETTLTFYVETDLNGMATWSQHWTSNLSQTTENP